MKRLPMFAVSAVLPILAQVAVLPAPAQAAQPIALHARTANDLADLCAPNPKEPGLDAKLNYCHGFAQGAVDVELRRAGDAKPFCFPNPAPSRSQTLAEFANWTRALPAHREMQVVDGLFTFLKERFPCK